MLKTIIYIGMGGFAGSISRYLITRYLDRLSLLPFPVGTITVNVLGCFLAGLVMGLAFQGSIPTRMRLLLATGFCGGFTTFSTYSLEIFELYQKGEAALSFLYLFISIFAGLLALWAGLEAVRHFAN